MTAPSLALNPPLPIEAYYTGGTPEVIVGFDKDLNDGDLDPTKWSFTDRGNWYSVSRALATSTSVALWADARGAPAVLPVVTYAGGDPGFIAKVSRLPVAAFANYPVTGP